MAQPDMAQADTALISSSLSNLAVQIPLIENHPKFQALDEVKNFQEELRGHFRAMENFRGEMQRALDQVQKSQQELRGDFAKHEERLTRVEVSLHHLDQKFDELSGEMEDIRDQLSREMGDIRDQLSGEIEDIRDQLSREQELLPLRFYNSSCGTKGLLQYPPGVQALRITRDDLSTFTIPQCHGLAASLDLPALPRNASATHRRQQIAAYLGASL